MTNWCLVLDDLVTFKDMSGISEEQAELFMRLQTEHQCKIVAVLDFLKSDYHQYNTVLFFEPALYGSFILEQCVHKMHNCCTKMYIYADEPTGYFVTMAFAHSMGATVLATCVRQIEPHMLYANVDVIRAHHAAARVFCVNDVNPKERGLVCLVPGQCAQPYRARFVQMGYAGTIVAGTPALFKDAALTNTPVLLNILANASMVYLGGNRIQAAHFEFAATGIVLVTGKKAAKSLLELGIHADIWENKNSGFVIRQPDHREAKNVRMITLHHTADMLARMIADTCVYRSKLRKPAES
jgi:hypothetical protein